jgi:hypothetical protein
MQDILLRKRVNSDAGALKPGERYGDHNPQRFKL